MQRIAISDEQLLIAIDAVERRGEDLLAVLDRLPAPIYVTDAQGVVTHFNAACIGFAGRVPRVGEDRWCVTWKLFTDRGEALPHDCCPMAVAIRERRSVRGVEAVAERPDGSRVAFRPYPTPLFDDAGNLAGAVNMLVEISGRERAASLREQALRCRRLAQWIDDPRTRTVLDAMAGEYESKAQEIEAPN